MLTDKAIARAVGVLFIAATAAAVLSVTLINPALDDADYLQNLAGDENTVILATLMDFVTALSVVGVAVMLFPVLRRHDSGIAMSYVGARLLEGVVIVVGGLVSLMLLTLSQEYTATAAPETADFEPLGAVLLGARDWTDAIGTTVLFGVAALILYPVLYRTELVPRFLSVWGFVGAFLMLAGGISVLYGASPSSPLSVVLTLPLAVNEMVLALWLIIRGFSAAAVASEPAKAVVEV